ncbi:hypothetical protein Bca4012_009554 [Brassica carinata]
MELLLDCSWRVEIEYRSEFLKNIYNDVVRSRNITYHLTNHIHLKKKSCYICDNMLKDFQQQQLEE